MDGKWLTIDEAAGVLRMGRTKVYRLAKEGRVPVSKVANQWRFERGELEKWMRDQRETGSATGSGYVHGYSNRESERLIDQAETLEELLHHDTIYPVGSLVLEAGCGVGAQTVALAARSPQANFIALDISENSLREAKKRVEEAGLRNVVFVRGDVYDLPFTDGNFDNVFVCFLLEHLASPEKALKCLQRVLKPGGTLTVIEGDHGSAYFHPDSKEARKAIECQVRLQKRGGGNSCIGRKLYPLLAGAGQTRNPNVEIRNKAQNQNAENALNEQEKSGRTQGSAPTGAGLFADVKVSPRMVYVDGSRPGLVEGFTRKTFTAMVEGVRQEAIDAGLADAATFDKGVADLYRTAEPDGVFCYTFFKATGIKK
jgi:excisionase family DNA binding protein